MTLILVAVFLAGLNLRLPIIAVPPLLPFMQPALGLSASLAGLLSSLPVFLLGVSAFLVFLIPNRVQVTRAIAAAMALLAAAIAGRSLGVLQHEGSAVFFFAGTVPIGVVIGVAQALVLVVIKNLPLSRQSTASGLLSLAVCASGAVAAATAEPLMHLFAGSWEWALAMYALPALMCAVVWCFVARPELRMGGKSRPFHGMVQVLRHPVTWALCMHMALQSMLSHATVTWLPTILQERGALGALAGLMLSAMMVTQLSTALCGAWIAGRYRSQGGVVGVMYLLALAGIFMVCNGSEPWQWAGAVLLGLGQGGTYSIGVYMIVLRSASAAVTAQLTGVTQLVGYGLAAIGPWLFGVMRDLQGSWDFAAPLFTLITLLGMAAAMVAGRPRLIGSQSD